MKILLLSSALSSGGAETHVTELALALSSLGHDVTVATAGGELVETLKKSSVYHEKLRLDTHSPTLLFCALTRLKRLLKRKSFDLIHTHSRIAALICRLAVGKRNIPIVSTVHARFRTSPLLRRLSFWGAHSIAVSEDLAEYLTREYDVPKDKISIIENGIDTEKFSPPKARHESTALRILFASRLDTDCSLGALLLVKLAERLHERKEGIIIEIAGGGKEQKRLSSLAKKVNFKLGYECVRLLGFCRDMPKCFKTADIFVGVSRAALEAMSAGVPSVLCGNEGFLGVLDASNIEKAARTNFCCRKEELPDSEKLFFALTTLIDMSDNERAELGSYLRSYVVKNHSLTSMAKNTEIIYKRAISEVTSQARPYTVLCGYYGAGNLGDDAILFEILKKLKASDPKREIYIISQKRKNFGTRGVRTVSKKNLSAVKKILKNADRLVLGGGSILQDKSSLRSLIYYTSLIKYAYRQGVRVELLSNGLGPLKRKVSRRLTSSALKCADRISMRDATAFELASELGAPKERLFLEGDLTESTPPCDDTRSTEILCSLSLENKEFALVSIRKRDSKKLKKELIKHLYALEIMHTTPVFVVMHKKEDMKISKRLAKKYGGKLFVPADATEICGLARLAKYAVGTRFHLLYLSKLSGIPVFPLGDDPKMKGL